MNKEEIMVNTITRVELKQKLDSGEDFKLVETLAPQSFGHAHLPGAVNLPPDKIAEMAPTILPDKGADIVVYCANPT